MVKQFTSTLGGFELLGSGPVRWVLREGTDPVEETFDVRPQDADALFKSSREGNSTVLNIQSEGVTITIQNLRVIQIYPGENPFIKRVKVADRRWYWKYSHVLRRYNKRRRIGFRRLKAVNPPELQDVVDRIWYAKFSLKNPASGASGKWTAEDVFDDLMKEAFRGEGVVPVVRKPDFFPRQLPIEGFEVDEPADQALQRFLGYIPEAGIFVDKDGTVVLYNKTDGTEAVALSILGPEMVGKGHVELVDNSIIRPKEIHVLYTIEAEVREDFLEATSKTGTFAINDNARTVENVLPSPDFVLHLADGTEITQGTWITVDQAMNAVEWGSVPGIGRLDHDILQKAFIPEMDLWTALQLVGLQRPDQNWAARVAMLQQHYRRTFRIPRARMDRVLRLKAYRVATVDVSNGERAPSTAYADFAIMNTQRSLFRDHLNNRDLSYAINVTGYPPSGLIDSSTIPAPAEVSILDEDQGIIHINYRVDPNKVYEQILPSNIDIGSMPTGNIMQRNRPIAFNQITAAGSTLPKLTANHKAAIILTMIPGFPNSRNQLYRVVVKPSDVTDLVPPAAAAGLANALGPPMEIRVGAEYETARVMWSDDRAADIDAIFGVPDGVGVPNLDGLVVNAGSNTDPANGASLNAIAKAVAAKFYSSLVDRFEGSATGYLNPKITLTGWMNELAHEVTTEGVAQTRISLPERLQKLDLLTYLDANTRAVIIHQAQG